MAATRSPLHLLVVPVILSALLTAACSSNATGPSEDSVRLTRPDSTAVAYGHRMG